MSLNDIIPIVAAIGVVLLLFAIVALFVRVRRKAAAAKAARAASAKPKTTLASTRQAIEDQQLLATLAPAPRLDLEPAAAPSPTSRRLAEIPVPLPTVEKKSAIEPTPARSLPTTPGTKIRLLIVDDNKDTRENVSRLIAFENDMEVIGQAYNGISGLEMAQDLRPHIVLMDINMPDMDGITATREMMTQVPYCQVVIMSVQFETDYMRAAMLAGARDYQIKPFSADELINCIRRVYAIGVPTYQQMEAAERAAASAAKSEVAIVAASPDGLTAPVFMIYGPKGGVGKTAIAINLAVALQQDHAGAALLDADLQMGDLPVDLNVRPHLTVTDLVASSRPDPELLPKVLTKHSSGINVVFGPQKPEQMELITGNMMIQIVRALRAQATSVVIDTASYLTDHNLALLEVANDVLLVINPDLPSIKNAKIFLELAPDVGLRPDRLALVINRATMPGAIPTAQIEKALKVQRIFSVPDDPKLRLSLIKGVSIFQLDANAPAALAIADMAKTLWARLFEPQAVVAAEAPKS
jgi:pilus assembly protein CpaE